MTSAGGSEPNPALRVLYRWFFDHIQVDETWVRQVRSLAERGRVVYVLRSLNAVDYLALDHLTRRFDLPRIRYVNDLSLAMIEPMDRGLASSLWSLWRRNDAEQLQAALDGGGSAALFMKRPPGVIDLAAGTYGRGQRQGDEHLRCLLKLQQERPEQPILLLPQVFVWTNRPDTQGTRWLDVVLGPREWPTTLRALGQFVSNYRNVELRAGESFDLAAYLHSSPEASEDVHVRRVMYAVLRRLERERRSATGPASAPPDRQRMRVLQSPALQEVISNMAGERREDRRALYRRAANMLRLMQATPNSATIRTLDVLLDRIFHRIYAGLEVDMDGLKQLRELTKDGGSLVLLPSHKSHVDYLVLSYIMYENNLPLPMIAAGDNLSFFPLGPVLRRAGGFFIRRSFKGDKLYSAAVEAYVRRLLREGHALELFLEGGRSRTGKLLEPKFGLLSMIVDAALGVQRPVHFIPVSIGYERIVETSSYEHEVSGGEKHKEDAAGLLKSTEVLRHRYGRITVQFAEPLLMDTLRRELSLPEGELNEGGRRALVTRLANRTMDAINQVTAVTPGALAALALLSSRRRSLSHEDLIERCAKLLGIFQQRRARIAPRTTEGGVLRPAAIHEALEMFVDAGMLEAHTPDVVRASSERRSARCGDGALYRVPEAKRVELDTSKNHIIHFLVERGLVALSVLHSAADASDLSTTRKRVLTLSKLFKHEFRFRADAAFDRIFEDTLTTMVRTGELKNVRGTLQPGDGHDGWTGRVWLLTYATSLLNFIEGYRVAARALTLLVKGPLTDKDLTRRAIALGNRMFLAGDIQMREAVSKPLLQNAFTTYREEGYLEQVADNKLALSPSFASLEAAGTIEGRLIGFSAFSAE
jgi:glycerol-3-phosphate O-acyltransferase